MFGEFFVTKLYSGSSLWENILICNFYPDKIIVVERNERSGYVSVMTMKGQTPRRKPYRIQERQSLNLTTKRSKHVKKCVWNEVTSKSSKNQSSWEE